MYNTMTVKSQLFKNSPMMGPCSIYAIRGFHTGTLQLRAPSPGTEHTEAKPHVHSSRMSPGLQYRRGTPASPVAEDSVAQKFAS